MTLPPPPRPNLTLPNKPYKIHGYTIHTFKIRLIKYVYFSKLLEIIDGATSLDSGRFIAWDGQDIPY